MTKRKRKHKIVDKDKLPLVGKVMDLFYPTVILFLIAFVLIFAKLINPTSETLNYGIISLVAGFFLLIIDYIR